MRCVENKKIGERSCYEILINIMLFYYSNILLYRNSNIPEIQYKTDKY